MPRGQNSYELRFKNEVTIETDGGTIEEVQDSATCAACGCGGGTERDADRIITNHKNNTLSKLKMYWQIWGGKQSHSCSKWMWKVYYCITQKCGWNPKGIYQSYKYVIMNVYKKYVGYVG